MWELGNAAKRGLIDVFDSSSIELLADRSFRRGCAGNIGKLDAGMPVFLRIGSGVKMALPVSLTAGNEAGLGQGHNALMLNFCGNW